MRRALVTGFAALAWAGSAAWSATEESSLPGLRKVERLHLDDAHPGVGGERRVELYLRTLTRQGDPVEELRAAHLEVRQDGERIDADDLDLTPLAETTHGVTSVLAIDVSRTMKGEPFERAKAAALGFAARLGERDRFAVVTFASNVDVVVPFSASRSQARVQLEALEIDPDPYSLSTLLFDGVYQAVDLLKQKDLPRRSFVIVLSDGNDSGSRHSLETLTELSSGSGSKAQVLIFAIGYTRFDKSGFDVLQQLASKTAAEFLPASSPLELNSFYDRVWRHMLRSYVLGFPAAMDGEAHTLEVLVDGQKDARTVVYPIIGYDIPTILFGMAVVLALAVIAVIALTRRSPGRLVFVEGPRAGDSVALRAGTLRVGSSPDNDVVVPSETVSRYHAEIDVNGRSVEVRDLRSTNGTQVNGVAIQRSPLRPGDRLRLADVDLTLER